MKPRPATQSGRTRNSVRGTNAEQNAPFAAVTNRHRQDNKQLRRSKPQRHPNDHAFAVRASQTLTTSDSTHLLMNKQINPIINGKGGGGKSFFATNFVQYLRDCGIAHCAIDSDHENAILKRFISVATPDVAKTLNFLRPGFSVARLLSSKVQILCSPFPEISHRALPSLRHTSASSAAPFIPTTRDHCSVLRIPYALATRPVNRFSSLSARCAL